MILLLESANKINYEIPYIESFQHGNELSNLSSFYFHSLGSGSTPLRI